MAGTEIPVPEKTSNLLVIYVDAFCFATQKITSLNAATSAAGRMELLDIETWTKQAQRFAFSEERLRPLFNAVFWKRRGVVVVA